ncbi:MAG: formate dehydrogenase accessory sulfurtransferase FdhD [Candidatus Adiutrix sp.]|jgi:FdhD protein|nr:formate dehydrogenase accessory sulfurtransferase FdhD [Candidatus Adiutrix sp.]
MTERRVRHYKNGAFSWEPAPLAEECRVDIIVNNRRRASVMASPCQLDSLAVGFLFGEGIISGVDDITSLSVNGLEVSVELRTKNAAPQPPAVDNCSLENTAPEAPLPPRAHPALDAAKILRLSDEFNSHSYLFRQTGAVHSCRLIDGPRQHHADDVARHNALDKVIGQYLMDGPSGEPGLVLTTGRISTEILIKSAKAGIGAVISRSAATDRAVELAGKLNMIMIGFARQNRFNVYHGGDLIEQATPRR